MELLQLEARMVLNSDFGGALMGSSPVMILPPGQESPPVFSRPSSFPLAQTFLLHSHPTATKTLYLDFNGHVTTNTGWNSPNNAWTVATPTITSAAYSIEGDASFSDPELNNIQEIFFRVSEFFSPFNIDVTTEQPSQAALLNTGGGDTEWGVRVVVGESTPASSGGSGWGFIGGAYGFGSQVTAGANIDTPAFAFPSALSNVTKYVADVCTHEAGHTLGLNHDGRITPSEGYYFGHGTGPTQWAPVMGATYYAALGQWSKGEYTSANNTQDDLDIITNTATNGFGYRADDFGDSSGAAGAIAGTQNPNGTATIDQDGVVETRTDTDWFAVEMATGAYTLEAFGGPRNTMLDIRLELYNSGGGLVQGSNPADDVTASISGNIATAGTYYVKIEGVGKGDPLGTGYTDYSSLGQYTITGDYFWGVTTDDHGDTAAAATLVAVPSTTPGDLEVAADNDFFKFNAVAGGVYTVNTTLGTLLDTTLALYDTDGTTQLDFDDDGGDAASSLIIWTAPATGTYYLDVRDYSNDDPGTYGLVISASLPNAKPVITNFGAPIIYTENAAALRISSTVLVSDPDSANFATGKLTVRFTVNGKAEDRLSIRPTGNLTLAGSDVRFNGVKFGVFVGGNGTTPLVITFTGAASPSRVQVLLRNIVYANVSHNPSTSPRTVSVQLTDGDGGTSVARTKTISITPVNDTPVLGGIGGTQGYVNNAAPVSLAPAATVVDVDSANFNSGKLTIRVTSGADVSNRIQLSGTLFTINASNRLLRDGVIIGTLNANAGRGLTKFEVTFNGQANASAVQQLLRSIRFRTVGSTTTVNRLVTFALTDGDGGTSLTRTKAVDVS